MKRLTIRRVRCDCRVWTITLRLYFLELVANVGRHNLPAVLVLALALLAACSSSPAPTPAPVPRLRVDTVLVLRADTVRPPARLDTVTVQLPPRLDTVLVLRVDTLRPPARVDTVTITPPPRLDTVLVLRVDTLRPPARVDTVTIIPPPRVDTVLVLRVDTVTVQLPPRPPRVDTLRVVDTVRVPAVTPAADSIPDDAAPAGYASVVEGPRAFVNTYAGPFAPWDTGAVAPRAPGVKCRAGLLAFALTPGSIRTLSGEVMDVPAMCIGKASFTMGSAMRASLVDCRCLAGRVPYPEQRYLWVESTRE